MSDRIHSLLIAHSQKVLLAVHTLKSATEAWQRGERETLDRFIGELSKLEKEADALRRGVNRELSHSELDHAKTELFRRLEYAAHISDLEKSVDDIEFDVQRKANQLQVDTWSAIIFWRLILTTGRIADSVEDAADELLAYEGEL